VCESNNFTFMFYTTMQKYCGLMCICFLFIMCVCVCSIAYFVFFSRVIGNRRKIATTTPTTTTTTPVYAYVEKEGVRFCFVRQSFTSRLLHLHD